MYKKYQGERFQEQSLSLWWPMIFFTAEQRDSLLLRYRYFASYSARDFISSFKDSLVLQRVKYFLVYIYSFSFICLSPFFSCLFYSRSLLISYISSSFDWAYSVNFYQTLSFSRYSFLYLQRQRRTVSRRSYASLLSLLIQLCNRSLSLSLERAFSLRKSISVFFSFSLSWKSQIVSSNCCSSIKSRSISLSFSIIYSLSSLISSRYSLQSGLNESSYQTIQLLLVSSLERSFSPLLLLYRCYVERLLMVEDWDFEGGTCTFVRVLSLMSLERFDLQLLSVKLTLLELLRFSPYRGTFLFALALGNTYDLVKVSSSSSDDSISELTV